MEFDKMVADTDSGDGTDSLRFFVHVGGKIGVYDNDREEIVVPIEYDGVVNHPWGFYEVTHGGKKGLFDFMKRMLVVATEYDEIRWDVEQTPEVYIVGNDGRFGLIGANGLVLIPLEYELGGEFGYFYHGEDSSGYPHFVIVGQNGKCGVYDVRNKRLAVEIKYSDVDFTVDGVAATTRENIGERVEWITLWEEVETE